MAIWPVFIKSVSLKHSHVSDTNKIIIFINNDIDMEINTNF